MKNRKVVVFLTGIPGAGKSAAARVMLTLARWMGREGSRLRDYDILCQMLAPGIEEDKVIPPEITPSMRASVAAGIAEYISNHEGLIVVELWRSLALEESSIPYSVSEACKCCAELFRNLDRDLLSRSHLLFLKTNLPFARKRVERRMANPRFLLDDHAAYRRAAESRATAHYEAVLGREEEIAKFLSEEFAVQVRTLTNTTFKWWFLARVAIYTFQMLMPWRR